MKDKKWKVDLKSYDAFEGKKTNNFVLLMWTFFSVDTSYVEDWGGR